MSAGQESSISLGRFLSNGKMIFEGVLCRFFARRFERPQKSKGQLGRELKIFLAMVKILWEMRQATHHFTTLCANHLTQK